MVHNSGDDHRLRGWKAIGAFLKTDERTAKRWEKTRGLPVQRIPGEPRAPVFAFRTDLERWLRSGENAASEPAAGAATAAFAPAPPEPKRRVLLIGAAAAVSLAASGAGLMILRGTPAPATPFDPEARRAWIDAEYALSTRTADGVSRANQLFAAVLAREPGFVPARARLAVSYNLMAQYEAIPGPLGYGRAEAAAQQAIDQDAGFAGGYAARGFARFYGRRDAVGAMSDLAQAIRLDRDSAETWQWLALIAMHGGDQTLPQRAIAQAERLDPRSRAIQANRALITMHAGREREAEDLLLAQRRMEGALGSVRHHLASLYLSQARHQEYLAVLAEIAPQDASRLQEGFRRNGAEGLLRARRDVVASQGDPFALAGAEAMLGNTASAFAALDRALVERQPETIAVMVDLPLAALRHEQQFGAYAVRAGFTPEALVALAGAGLRLD